MAGPGPAVVQEVECWACHREVAITTDDQITARTYQTTCPDPDCRADIEWTDEGDG